MNRQTQREITRLEKLRNFILANPSAYSQSDPENCILGLGLRLRRGKLNPYDWDSGLSEEASFANYYGVSKRIAAHINTNDWQIVNPRMKNVHGWAKRTTKQATSLLNYIIKQKAKGIKL